MPRFISISKAALLANVQAKEIQEKRKRKVQDYSFRRTTF